MTERLPNALNEHARLMEKLTGIRIESLKATTYYEKQPLLEQLLDKANEVQNNANKIYGKLLLGWAPLSIKYLMLIISELDPDDTSKKLCRSAEEMVSHYEELVEENRTMLSQSEQR